MIRALCVFAVLVLGYPLTVWASVPRTMSYQGVLTDGSGTPVADGNVELTFTLHDAATDGAALWSETQQVEVRRGVFSTILGKTTALNIPFDRTYWLGVAVNGGDELTPRTELVATPYALSAEDVSGAGILVRNINGLTDSVIVIGEGGTTVTTRGDTLVITSIIPSGGGGGILGLQDPTASLFIVNPNGPIATVSVANLGILRRHIAGGAVVKSLNTLTDFVTLVEGENVDITTITGAGSNDIRIDAFAQGGTVGGDLIVSGDLDVQGGSTHTGTEVFKGDIVAATFTDTVVLNSDGLAFVNSFLFGSNSMNVSAQGIRLRLENKGQIRLDRAGLALVDSFGLPVWEITQDGFSLHYKKEYFADTLVIDEGGAIAFPDGSVQSTAAVGAGGKFENVPLIVTNANGDTTFQVSPDGTSYHSGTEWFEAGVILIDDPGGPDFAVVDTSGNVAIFLDGKEFINVANDDPGNNHPSVTAGKGTPQENRSASQAAGELLEVAPPALEAGTAAATAGLPPEGPAIFGFSTRADGVAIEGILNNPANTNPAIWGLNSGGGAGVVGQIQNTSSIYPALWGFNSGAGSALLLDHVGSSGDILLGRNGAQATPVVRIDKTGKGFFNGGTQTGGADVAEAFAVEGSPVSYEPGDVLVISTGSDRTVERSAEPYSTLVAGVYATKPGVLLSERSIDDPQEDLVPMGVVGVIPTKVSGENGPIRRGDLLVTSTLPGHAMKGNDRSKLVGAVLGKALENFDGSGTGVIRVLVSAR